jgi:hypothetical protein
VFFASGVQAAAERGDLKILRWARDHGCPWDERLVEKALEAGRTHIAQWAVDNGCACDVDTYERLVQASARSVWEHLVNEGTLLAEIADALSDATSEQADNDSGWTAVELAEIGDPWLPPSIFDFFGIWPNAHQSSNTAVR